MELTVSQANFLIRLYMNQYQKIDRHVPAYDNSLSTYLRLHWSESLDNIKYFNEQSLIKSEIKHHTRNYYDVFYSFTLKGLWISFLIRKNKYVIKDIS